VATQAEELLWFDRVTTRGGDTSLGDGSRVSKADPRIEAIGAIDEVNASIGALRIHTRTAWRRMRCSPGSRTTYSMSVQICVCGTSTERLRLTDSAVARLEAKVTTMNASLPALKSFILPGGNDAAAFAHVARVAARRAERTVVAVDDVNPVVGCYLNRLSDHPFVLARVLNRNAEVLWVPGASRS
jgi:cob(I)alamin adenosyltransferase